MILLNINNYKLILFVLNMSKLTRDKAHLNLKGVLVSMLEAYHYVLHDDPEIKQEGINLCNLIRTDVENLGKGEAADHQHEMRSYMSIDVNSEVLDGLLTRVESQPKSQDDTLESDIKLQLDIVKRQYRP